MARITPDGARQWAPGNQEKGIPGACVEGLASWQDTWESHQPPLSKGEWVGDGGCRGPDRCRSSFLRTLRNRSLRVQFSSLTSAPLSAREEDSLAKSSCLKLLPFGSPSLQRALTFLGK